MMTAYEDATALPAASRTGLALRAAGERLRLAVAQRRGGCRAAACLGFAGAVLVELGGLCLLDRLTFDVAGEIFPGAAAIVAAAALGAALMAGSRRILVPVRSEPRRRG